LFEVEKRKFGVHDEYVIVNGSTGESATIAALGANVRGLELGTEHGRPLPVILGYETPEELLEGQWSRGTKLIPFPNRIRDGRYQFGGKELQLPINFPSQHHAIHGLLRKEVLSPGAIEAGEKSGSVVLDFDFGGRFPGYPFDLHVSVRHTLSEGGFRVRTLAENRGDRPLPFGDGWHPYFRFGDSAEVNNWRISIPAGARVAMDDRLIPTGSLIPVEGTEYDFREGRTIGSLVLDDVYTNLESRGGVVETELFNDEMDATIRVWQDSRYGYLVIFTPPGDNRNCVAIEPMTCNTNAFNNRQGLTILEPGDTFEGEYGVILE
jgi:aldose 1-epimerase